MTLGSPQYISVRDEFIIKIIPVKSDSINWLVGLGSNDDRGFGELKTIMNYG